ncbi:CopG family transcriptional regulator [Campylobacter sp. RM16188]|uniref:ribbon-helix-helix domain-containing protein n=1 Tax=Campylobacter sp. RM16188 TaxID=1705725 RepID=UPI0015558833|nr:CopG family transcriptional regulator [Campylobacter sp. RM16188]
MKNLSNFNLNSDVSKNYEAVDEKENKTAELEAQLAKYKKLGRPKSENPPTKQMTIYLSENEMEFLEKSAKQRGVTKNQILRDLLTREINDQN